ncbi:MAG: glycoside hydrolase family 20 zincin-like fold domain-containing protein, partial [Oscillospiraceae bacterium]|nr:glycoside hydrolase family 20 zincin-like fold domain-containing protein [Oscillospiraceae bacterium]
MVFYFDHRFTQVQFGVKKLRESLRKNGVFFVERFLFDYAGNKVEDGVITVSFTAQNFRVRPSGELQAEGFEFLVDGKDIHIIGADATGAMYGLLELSEDIALGGLKSVESKVRNPFLKK